MSKTDILVQILPYWQVFGMHTLFNKIIVIVSTLPAQMASNIYNLTKNYYNLSVG